MSISFPQTRASRKLSILSASHGPLHSTVTGVIRHFSTVLANCTDFCLVFNDDSSSTFVFAAFSSCCVVWANTQQQLQQPPPPTTTTTTKQQHRLHIGLETLFIAIATLYSSQFNSALSLVLHVHRYSTLDVAWLPGCPPMALSIVFSFSSSSMRPPLAWLPPNNLLLLCTLPQGRHTSPDLTNNTQTGTVTSLFEGEKGL